MKNRIPNRKKLCKGKVKNILRKKIYCHAIQHQVGKIHIDTLYNIDTPMYTIKNITCSTKTKLNHDIEIWRLSNITNDDGNEDKKKSWWQKIERLIL